MTRPNLGRATLPANIILAVLACSAVLGLGRGYGTRYYTSVPDETLFVDIASNLATTGVFGGPAYAGNGLKMSEKTYFVPPLYPATMAGWFRISGTRSIAAGRVLSNLFGVFLVLAVFGILLCWQPRTLWPGVTACLLACDPSFAWLFNCARPDILALAFSYGSLLLYARAIGASPAIQIRTLALSFIVATCGRLTHPVAGSIGFASIGLHILLCRPRDRTNVRVWTVLIVTPLAGLMLWGLYILQDTQAFRYQFIDWQLGRKSTRISGADGHARALLDVVLNFGVKAPGAGSARCPR